MALIHCDSFPYNSLAQMDTIFDYHDENGNQIFAYPTGGLGGGGYLRIKNMYSNTYWVKLDWGGTNDTICVQMGYQGVNITAAPNAFCTFRDGTTEQMKIRHTTNGLAAYRGSTLLGQGSALCSTGAWHNIEIKVKIHSSAGTVFVKQDGVTVINLTDQNTQSTGNAQITGLLFDPGSGTDANEFYMSDLIVMNTTGSYCNDLLGQCLVKRVVPTGDSATYAQCEPSTGSDHYALVDESPASETDYLSADVDEIDTFTKASLGLSGASIVHAVVPRPYAKTSDGGTAALKGVVRSGGSDGLGLEAQVSSTPQWLFSPIYVDPNTSAPFTRANFDNAEVGFKRTA